MVFRNVTFGYRTAGQLLMENRIFKPLALQCLLSCENDSKNAGTMLKNKQMEQMALYGRILFAFNLWQPLPTGGHQMDNID